MRYLTSVGIVGLLLQGCGGSSGDGGSLPSVYFVRAGAGDDNNTGLSADDALRSIEAAVAKAEPGDTIIVGPGSYLAGDSEDAAVEIAAKTGSASKPIIVRGDDGTETGDALGEAIVDGNERGFGFRITGSSYIVVEGFVVRGARGNEGAGVQIRDGSRGVVVRHNEITESADGIRIEASSDSVIFNNLIHSNLSRGVQISDGSSANARTRIVNNTITANGNDGVSANGSRVTDLQLRNNIVFDNRARGIDIDDTSIQLYDGDFNLVAPTERNGVSVDYGPSTPKGLNDISLDPLFSGRFRLTQAVAGDPVDSPAVDAGDTQIDASLADALRRRTTATNDLLDEDEFDLGYHFPSSLVPEPTPTVSGVPTPVPTTGPTTRIYVRGSAGDDRNDGKSPATAVKTIQKAVDAARPGTEIIVGPGRYAEEVHVTISGQEARPIVIRADAKGRDTGDAAGQVVLDGGGLRRGFFVDGAKFVAIDGFTIEAAAIAGVHVRSEAEGVVIRNCEVFASREDGIRIQDSPSVSLVNNLIYCNARRGVLIAGAAGSNDSSIVNNTILANRDRGLFIGTSTAPSLNAFVRNNIIQDNCNRNLQVVDNSAGSFDGQYNLVSPPSYVGVSAHPTDTAYGPDGTTVDVPAGFAARAVCDGVCRKGASLPLPTPVTYSITRSSSDFRLKQTIAGDPPPDGTGVDRGDPSLAKRFTDVVRAGSTAVTGQLDGGRVDMGYHFVP